MIKTQAAKPQKVPEKEIQAALVRRLSRAGWLTVRINSSAFKTDSGHYVRGYSVAGLAVSAGFPDIVAFRGGACVLVEVKTEEGTLSDSQKKFHNYAAARGVRVLVCRSVADLENELGNEL